MKKIFVYFSVILCLFVFCGAGYEYPNWSDNQIKAHEIAEIARSMGLDENNPIIQEAKNIWESETEEVKILANTVYYESKYCTDRHQQLVAQVVINRVNDIRFPNDIKSVIKQPNQYAGNYTSNLPDYISCNEEMKRCFINALEAIRGNVECPPNVIYQSNYESLGTEHYEVIYINTGYYSSTTYFAYG